MIVWMKCENGHVWKLAALKELLDQGSLELEKSFLIFFLLTADKEDLQLTNVSYGNEQGVENPAFAKVGLRSMRKFSEKLTS